MLGDPYNNGQAGLQGLQGLQGILGAGYGSALGAQQAQMQAQQSQQAAQMQAQAQYDRFKLDDKTEEELKLRKENPGVKEAWEQYQIMLKLSRA